MKLTATMIVLFSLVGCDQSYPNEWPVYQNVILPENRERAAAWVLECVKNANPHSDEEPEDNIAQAQKTATDLFGKPTLGMRMVRNQTWMFIPLENLPPEKQAKCKDWAQSH